MLFIAAWIVKDFVEHISAEQLTEAIFRVPKSHIFLAVILTMCNYIVLTSYDVLALKKLRQRLPYSNIALTSFIAYAFSNNVGFPLISSNTIRLRLYRRFGISVSMIAKLAAYCCATFWLGFAALGSVVFLLHPPHFPAPSVFSPATIRLFGAALLTVLTVAITAIAMRKNVRVGSWQLKSLDIQTLLLQMLFASLEITVAASVLYVLLPFNISFVDILGIFLISQIASLASQVPGGVGVFEAMILLFLPKFDSPSLISALLLYRLVYYFLPLVVAFLLLAYFESGKGMRYVPASGVS